MLWSKALICSTVTHDDHVEGLQHESFSCIWEEFITFSLKTEPLHHEYFQWSGLRKIILYFLKKLLRAVSETSLETWFLLLIFFRNVSCYSFSESNTHLLLITCTIILFHHLVLCLYVTTESLCAVRHEHWCWFHRQCEHVVFLVAYLLKVWVNWRPLTSWHILWIFHVIFEDTRTFIVILPHLYLYFSVQMLYD